MLLSTDNRIKDSGEKGKFNFKCSSSSYHYLKRQNKKKSSPVMLARDFYRSVENTNSFFATDQPKLSEK